MSTTPRRPLVPSPTPRVETTPGGIAGRAVAVREQAQKQALPQKTNGQPPQPLRSTMAPVYIAQSPVGHIAGAIAAVMSKVGNIEKRGRNEYFGYNYARMEDLLYAVTPLMGSVGLAVIQNEVSKEILEGNRLAVTYEFSIFHSSGEVWPEKPRFTGVCISRDRKGNWDDKAVAKCHTNARKYFLLALFQVPAGDFPDVDEDANQRDEKAPVPGPSQRPAEAAPAQPAQDDSAPHRITLGPGKGPDEWASAFIRSIGKAQSVDEVKAWDAANEPILQNISDNFPGTYDMIQVAVGRRLSDLSEVSGGNMPSDPGEALNWVAGQLAQLQSLEAAEAFWNRYVAPRESDFDDSDWSMLMAEWQRTEARLNPPDDEPQTERE
jgi:ERF superfamily